MPAKEDSLRDLPQQPFDLAVVVTGGDAPGPEVLGHLPSAQRIVVIGADSGVDHARALGLEVDIAVGDFDSIDPKVLGSIEGTDVEIRRHPVDKDATDLELAIEVARDLGVTRLVVIGGHGGRLDHLLGNAMLLADSRYAGLQIVALMGTAIVTVVHPGSWIELSGDPDTHVSLLAVHGPAHDVHLEGLRWPLAGESLAPGATLGISNRFVGSTARIRLGAGTVLVIQPGGAP